MKDAFTSTFVKGRKTIDEASLPPLTPELKHAAALTVIQHATDVDDARTLLRMLDLDGGAS
jgi:hypothetical protein